jgi:hypothetical protein
MTAADLIRALQAVPPDTHVVITTTAQAAHRDIPLELHHILVHRSEKETEDGSRRATMYVRIAAFGPMSIIWPLVPTGIFALLFLNIHLGEPRAPVWLPITVLLSVASVGSWIVYLTTHLRWVS